MVLRLEIILPVMSYKRKKNYFFIQNFKTYEK